jgi:ubiquinone/menaquinone biosynthesis C-methylase UbiE
MTDATRHSQSGTTGYPIDAENAAEMARLSKQGQLVTELLGLLPWSLDPNKHPRILDIGCGPGEWALMLAQTYPDCEVVGIDRSTIMIAYATSRAQALHVPHLRYLVTDASQPLPFPDASFDVVHIRFAAAWQSTAGWPRLLAECARLTAPQGMICSTETESIGIILSPAFARYNAQVMDAFRQVGKCFTSEGAQFGITAMQEKLLAQAGFTHLLSTSAALNYSAGTPAHPIWLDNYRTALKLLQPFLIQSGLTTKTDIDRLYERAMEEFQSNDFSAINYFHTVYGEKT